MLSRMEDEVSLDLPAGLTSRPATAADATAIFELVAACETADDGAVEVDEDDFAVAFGRHGFDLAKDTVLILDGEQLVAWAELYRSRSEGDVRPSHRGRGIGSQLLRWIELRARAHGDAVARQTTSDANTGARDLFLSNGYEASFVSWIIRIELDEPPEPPDVARAGLVHEADPHLAGLRAHPERPDRLVVRQVGEALPAALVAGQLAAHRQRVGVGEVGDGVVE